MNGYNENHKMTKSGIITVCMGFVSLAVASAGFAGPIKIQPNTIISSPTAYDNVTLDMSNGNFVITNNATLTITNSVVNGTLSASTPNLFTVQTGKLEMDDNHVNIHTHNLTQHPLTQSLENVMQIGLGNVSLSGNTFTIDQDFTAGLLVTTATIPSTGINITNNTFQGFHGVLYLIASDNSIVSNNSFVRNSYGHIVIIGNNSKITHNSIFFSGNYRLGNSIDVIDSDNVMISDNQIFTPTCHGIYILNSQNMVINGNKVFGGITYAMNVLSFPETMDKDDKYLLNLVPHYKMKHTISNNVTISNNFMSQNRFGVAVSDTDGLTVNNNMFIQRFVDAASRKFWTNNSVLLQHVTNLNWSNNLYKEAYTQEVNGDNSLSNQFVLFPQTGGVSL